MDVAFTRIEIAVYFSVKLTNFLIQNTSIVRHLGFFENSISIVIGFVHACEPCYTPRKSISLFNMPQNKGLSFVEYAYSSIRIYNAALLPQVINFV